MTSKNSSYFSQQVSYHFLGEGGIIQRQNSDYLLNWNTPGGRENLERNKPVLGGMLSISFLTKDGQNMNVQQAVDLEDSAFTIVGNLDTDPVLRHVPDIIPIYRLVNKLQQEYAAILDRNPNQ